ncbi:MAG: RusA family crossover junction endodeoxyribonuclease [Sulfurimonas sp.]|nr:RusA family crossover junction endodeoxyribonuclease [Sulfurimonas sp.]
MNRLYQPVIRNSKPAIIKTKAGKESTKHIQIEALRTKANKMLTGDLSMKIDFCIAKGKNEPDVDAVIKLTLDSLEDVMYKNDKQIKFLQVAKHLNQEESELIVLVEEMKVENKSQKIKTKNLSKK